MSNGYMLEVYDDLEDVLYMCYEDRINGHDLIGRVTANGLIEVLGWDEEDEDKQIVLVTVTLAEFLRMVLSR